MAKYAYRERFGDAFVAAVASHADCILEEPKTDDIKVDWRISCNMQAKWSNPNVELQLKTLTAFAREDASSFYYDLDVDAYNWAVEKSFAPRYVVLILLPSEKAKRLFQHKRGWLLRSCAYWVSLKGKRPSTHSASVRIDVPRSNIFTPAALLNLLKRAGARRPI